MRYEVTTTLAPQAAIAYAKNYFGPQGIGLEVIDEHETSVTLMGGGGHVSVVACSGGEEDYPGVRDTRVGLPGAAVYAGSKLNQATQHWYTGWYV